jgi:hypothetical protein
MTISHFKDDQAVTMPAYPDRMNLPLTDLVVDENE